MPRIYGLDQHLDGKSRQQARQIEPIEIRAVAEYLLKVSEPFEPLAAAAGATAAPSAQRGKQLFQLQGCLACHRHSDFPQATATQGPELSGIGASIVPAAAPPG